MNKIECSEHDEQVNLIQWFRFKSELFGISEQLLFAIPNGGQRNILVARKLKAEGVRAGVPDLFLAYPNHRHCGLFIEMKKESNGRASDSQKGFLKLLNETGYLAVVCKGWQAASEVIEKYLKDEI